MDWTLIVENGLSVAVFEMNMPIVTNQEIQFSKSFIKTFSHMSSNEFNSVHTGPSQVGGTGRACAPSHFLADQLTLHAIWSYNERWDFLRAGSSLFLPRFSGLTFLRFLGLFFIFSEIFTK